MLLEEPHPSLSSVSVPQTSPAKPTWEYPFSSQSQPRNSTSQSSQSSQSNLPHPCQITANRSGLQPTSSSRKLEQHCELDEQRQALRSSLHKSEVSKSCVADPLQPESESKSFCIVAEAALRAEKAVLMRICQRQPYRFAQGFGIRDLEGYCIGRGQSHETAPTYWS